MVCTTYSWCNYFAKEIFGILSAFSFPPLNVCLLCSHREPRASGLVGLVPRMCRDEPITCEYNGPGGSDFRGVPGADAGEVRHRVVQPDHHEKHRKIRSGFSEHLHGGFTSVFVCFVSFVRRLISASLPPTHTHTQVNWSNLQPGL